MENKNEFLLALHDIFAEFGPITSKRMFGGYGIYHQKIMFALVADNVLYLKTDAQNVEMFTNLQLGPFEYPKNGKMVKMSYYQAPEAVFEHTETAAEWAKLAFAAAMRNQKPQKNTLRSRGKREAARTSLTRPVADGGVSPRQNPARIPNEYQRQIPPLRLVKHQYHPGNVS